MTLPDPDTIAADLDGAWADLEAQCEDAGEPEPPVRPDFAAYAAIEAVNWSKLKLLRDGSPLAYRYAIEHPDDGDTASRGMLRAAHALALEPERFTLDYAVWCGRRQSKVYAAFAAEHSGRTILNDREHEQAQALADAVRAHPVAGPLLTDPAGRSEVSIAWTDPETGLWCKGRIDRLAPRGRRLIVVDLKTVGSIHSRAVSEAAARMGWHCQLAHYVDGVAITHSLGRVTDLEPEVDAVLVCVESKPPYDVGVFRLTADSALGLGNDERRKLLAQLAECIRLDQWPGRYPTEQPLELPAWSDPDFDLDTEIHIEEVTP